MKFWDFPDLSWFPRVPSLKLFRSSWGNFYIPYLLLIITLRFTFGEQKFGKVSKNLKILSPWLPVKASIAPKAPIVKNCHILAEIYFIFLIKRSGPNLKFFQYRIWTSNKWKVAFFCNWDALILGENCVKGLIITEIVSKIMFKGACNELKLNNCF